MQKYIAPVVLTLCALVLFDSQPVIAQEQEAQNQVISACQALDKLKGYHFDMKTTYAIENEDMAMSFSMKPKGLCKNPDFCYFKMSSPEGMFGGDSDEEIEIYCHGNAVVTGHGKKGEDKDWEKGFSGAPFDEDALAEQLFTPFYQTADLEEFLQNSRFTKTAIVNKKECRIVEAVIPKECLKDVLNIGDLLKETPFGRSGKMELSRAIYKFWIGKDNHELHQTQRIIEHTMTEEEDSKFIVKLTIDMTIFDRDKSLDIKIPDPAKDILAGKAKRVSKGMSANETSVAFCLQTLIACEATWRQQDSDSNGRQDFWVYDVSCFYRMFRADGQTKVQAIDITFAQADAQPADGKTLDKRVIFTPEEGWPIIPKHGYLFKALEFSKANQPYGKNDLNRPAMNTGILTGSDFTFSFCAFPAQYGKTGTKTFIVNQAGVIYSKDLGAPPNQEEKEPELTLPLEQRINELIPQLGAEDWQKRDAATKELKEIAQPALAQLEKTRINASDPEIKIRLDLIITHLTSLTREKSGMIDQWPGADPTAQGWQIVQ